MRASGVIPHAPSYPSGALLGRPVAKQRLASKRKKGKKGFPHFYRVDLTLKVRVCDMPLYQYTVPIPWTEPCKSLPPSPRDRRGGGGLAMVQKVPTNRTDLAREMRMLSTTEPCPLTSAQPGAMCRLGNPPFFGKPQTVQLFGSNPVNPPPALPIPAFVDRFCMRCIRVTELCLYTLS